MVRLDSSGRGTVRLALFGRSLLVLGLLYSFLVAISLLGSTFKELGEGQAVQMVSRLSPIPALAVGILVTVLVQSSSVTTSLIVGIVATSSDESLADGIRAFVPMIMGANIGTTITNTLASLGHVTRSKEFERAFAGATMHDFFNLLTVVVLLPLELATGILTRLAVLLVEFLNLSGSVEFKSPVKTAVKSGVSVVKGLIKDDFGLSGTLVSTVLIAVSVSMIFVSLALISRNLKVLMASRLEAAVNRALAKSGLLGIFIGMVVTVLVQSSSITTSIMIPMFGAGILTLSNGFSIMLGANVGTTLTALMAAVVKGPAGLAIAFVHLLFNLLGILIFYPIPALRNLPVRLAEKLAERTLESKLWILIYVGGAFVGLPLLGFLVLS